MKKIAMFALIFATCMSQAAPAFSQADKVPSKTAGSAGPLGKWVTESGNLEVDIAPCGAALCGSVSRVISNRSMSPGGEAPKADALPLAGLKILSDFFPDGEGEWNGKIYNRDKAKTYDCVMTLLGPNELKIRGYKFLPIFGSTQIWRRVKQS